jgi:hypothetical protein
MQNNYPLSTDAHSHFKISLTYDLKQNFLYTIFIDGIVFCWQTTVNSPTNNTEYIF